MWGSHDGMGWWMVLGGMMWLLFWGTVVWLILTTARPRQSPGAAPDALDVARRRYASGEITREAFQQLQRDLTGDSTGAGGT